MSPDGETCHYPGENVHFLSFDLEDLEPIARRHVQGKNIIVIIVHTYPSAHSPTNLILIIGSHYQSCLYLNHSLNKVTVVINK